MSEVWHRGSHPLRHHRRSKFVGEFLSQAGSEPRQANSWKKAQMLHPALRQSIATAHIEDLHRAAAPPDDLPRRFRPQRAKGHEKLRKATSLAVGAVVPLVIY